VGAKGDGKMSHDKELIDKLGGSTKVAGRLGYSVQRVQNWKIRGVPAKVRLDHPHVFPFSSPPNQHGHDTNLKGK
jgi:hypothetical protein